MADDRLRELERRWRESGSPEDFERWRQERLRAREYTRHVMVLNGVVTMLPDEPPTLEVVEEHLRELGRARFVDDPDALEILEVPIRSRETLSTLAEKAGRMLVFHSGALSLPGRQTNYPSPRPSSTTRLYRVFHNGEWADWWHREVMAAMVDGQVVVNCPRCNGQGGPVVECAACGDTGRVTLSGRTVATVCGICNKRMCDHTADERAIPQDEMFEPVEFTAHWEHA